jgi:hypothetical protein
MKKGAGSSATPERHIGPGSYLSLPAAATGLPSLSIGGYTRTGTM